MPVPPLRDIEWQLVMHFSAHADIARFARCSKDTLRATSSPFAWRHATVCLDSFQGYPQPPAHAPTTFLRVHFLWRPSRNYTNQIVQADVDDLLASTLKIEHLDASWNTHIEAKFWMQVLHAPIMQRVSQLSFHRGLRKVAPPLPRGVLRLLFRLPKLHTLDAGFLSGSGFRYTVLDENASLLTSSLISLTIRDSGVLRWQYATTLQHFARCPLKYLSITHCGLVGTQLSEFFQSPTLRGLESLRFEEYDFTLTRL